MFTCPVELKNRNKVQLQVLVKMLLHNIAVFFYKFYPQAPQLLALLSAIDMPFLKSTEHIKH